MANKKQHPQWEVELISRMKSTIMLQDSTIPLECTRLYKEGSTLREEM